MKQKDIALIIVIAFVSGVFSLLISNALFSSSEKRKQEVEVIEPITADFEQPSNKYFNELSINPTKTILIGDSPNAQPFNGR